VAARGLSLLKAPAALKPLIALLSDKDAGVRIAAADGLGRLGDVTAVEPLAKLLDNSDFKLQVAAAIALVRLDDPRGPEQIAACLKDPDAQRREHAATEVCVSFLKTAALVPPLIAALDDPSIRVRLYAAGALGRTKTEAAAAALLAKVDDREHLHAILQALAQSNDDNAPALLLRHLDDAEPGVRIEASAGLSEFGSRSAIEPLIKHLADPGSDVRLAVIDALLKLRATESLPALRAMLADEDPEIHARAARAVKRLTAMPQPCVDGK
jgi:HEAT repeat protein